MPHLLGIHIKNFKAFRDVTIGQIGYGRGVALPRFACFIGPNGSGKSTLLDVFGFLSDCLAEGVEAACDKEHRGGLEVLRTQGATDPIAFDLYFRQTSASRPITYSLSIDQLDGRPAVASETLLQRRKGQKHGRPFPLLRLVRGAGEAWSGEALEGEEISDRVDVELDDISRLGITTLGQLREHPRILGLRAYIEGWYLSYFVPDAARRLPPSGAQKHLDRTGANVGNYVQYLARSFPDQFESVLRAIAQRVPGILSISHKISDDRRLLLQFGQEGFIDPFFQNSMSDGTLKLLAYMLLLEDPEPRPFIGIEEPENGLYHRLLPDLARQFRAHASGGEATQVLVTTHSPNFVDALEPDEVWLLQKNETGGVEAQRASELPTIAALHGEGIPLGSLWFSNHMNERGFEVMP